MPKFIITDRIPCWVEFKYEVKAENIDEAREKYRNGEWDHELGMETNENIDGIENQIKIEKAK